MNYAYAIQSICEILLAVFFIWGLFNEEKLAVLERKLFRKIFKKKQRVTSSEVTANPRKCA